METNKGGFWSKVTRFELAAFILVGVAATQVHWLGWFEAVLLAVLAIRFTTNWRRTISRALASSAIVVILSVGTVVIGALASVWSGELGKSPPVTWISQQSLPPQEFAATIFWVALFLWAVMFYTHRHAVVAQEGEESARLERLVVRAPHRRVFNDASRCVSVAKSGLQKARASAPERRVAEAAGAIVLVLAEVARFAKSFGGRNDAKYGANLMIARSVQEAKTDPALGGRLRFFDKDRESWASLRAVLSMEERFLVSDHEDRSASTKRAVPVICLPVPLTALGASGRWLALPGAPMTLLDDRPGIHQNLTQFVADCRAFGDFRQSVIDEVAAYFATEAKSVQSFASYKIGSNAVLNLDCSETCLLGEEEEFIATFSALVLPTQLLVADLVALVYP